MDVKSKILSVTHASLIPFIINANLLLIFGIIKTKRNKFTSSQILFLTLFSGDLTRGFVQLPAEIHLLWNPHEPTCFKVHLSKFSMMFPIIMSGTLLCVISVDRYIYVVHNNYYKKIVTKRSLTITIVWVIATSVTWTTLEVVFGVRLERAKIAKLYFAMSAYSRAIVAVAVVLYAVLLRKVKQTIKNSSVPQGIDSSLAKTIAIIVAIEVVTYFSIMVFLNAFAYELLNSTDKCYIQKLRMDLLWTALPCQINAIINSVIYLAKNGPMKRYYSKLFNCGINKRNLRKVAHRNMSLNGETRHATFRFKVSSQKS